MSTKFNGSKYFDVSLTIQFSIYTFFSFTRLDVKTVNFKQFTITWLHSLVIFDPEIGPYQVLPLRVRADLGAMTMKGNSAFSKAPVLLKPYHQNFACHIRTLVRGDLPLCRYVVEQLHSRVTYYKVMNSWCLDYCLDVQKMCKKKKEICLRKKKDDLSF